MNALLSYQLNLEKKCSVQKTVVVLITFRLELQKCLLKKSFLVIVVVNVIFKYINQHDYIHKNLYSKNKIKIKEVKSGCDFIHINKKPSLSQYKNKINLVLLFNLVGMENSDYPK